MSRGLAYSTLPAYQTQNPVPPPPGWTLSVRVTPTTWVDLSPLSRAGDYFWHNVLATGIPAAKRAYNIGSRADLDLYNDATMLTYFTAIEFDNEAKPASAALQAAIDVQAWIDAFNTRNAVSWPLHIYHLLNSIDGAPTIVNYGTRGIVGKSQYTDGQIPANLNPYIAKIQAAGKEAAVLLGYQDHGYLYTNAEIITNFHRVLDAAPYGCGLTHVSFYYDLDLDGSLLAALNDPSLARP